MDGKGVEILRASGILDQVVEKTVAVITPKDAEEHGVFPSDEWIDKAIEITLDLGCCDHIMDVTDAPGYGSFLVESPGSKRDQMHVVGNGAEVPSEGQVTLNLESDVAGKANLIKSVLQVTEITRPLMSVSKICDLGHRCIFDKDKAEVISKDGHVLCSFERKGGLYVTSMKLKAPEGFHRPA